MGCMGMCTDGIPDPCLCIWAACGSAAYADQVGLLQSQEGEGHVYVRYFLRNIVTSNANIVPVVRTLQSAKVRVYRTENGCASCQGTTRFTGKVEEQQEPKAKKTDGTLTSYVHHTIHFMTSTIYANSTS
jgi:hypothetical protein